jgi:Ca2+/Na+ antiporter
MESYCALIRVYCLNLCRSCIDFSNRKECLVICLWHIYLHSLHSTLKHWSRSQTGSLIFACIIHFPKGPEISKSYLGHTHEHRGSLYLLPHFLFILFFFFMDIFHSVYENRYEINYKESSMLCLLYIYVLNT